MDEKFLELWGNMLINAARGKKQSKDFFNWLQTGFPGMMGENRNRTADTGLEDLNTAFKQIYGLNKLSEQSDEYKKLSDKALKDFKQSFKDYLAMMGFVSSEEHLALVEKYEKLKARCQDQEETIKHQQMLLNAKGAADASEMMSPLQDMVKKQGEVFQQMMNDFGQYFGGPQKASDTQPPKRNKKDDRDGSESDR